MKRDQETSGKIAHAALALLEKSGAAAVTMRRVAQAVGITPMAIYYHFPNRDALLRVVTEAEFGRIVDLFDAGVASGTPLTRLRRMTESYVDYALKRPKLFDYIFSQSRPDALRFPDDFQAGRSPLMNRVADAVTAAMRAGTLRKDDVWEVTLALWGFVHGLVALYRGGRFALTEANFRALFRRSLRRFLRGLRPA